MNRRSVSQEIAANYYQTTAQRSYKRDRSYYEAAAKQIERKLRPWLPHNPQARCPDLGCGCGAFIYLLEKRGLESTFGVDACAEEIEAARQFVKVELETDDAFDYLKKQCPASFDFISALNFLEQQYQGRNLQHG